MISNPRVPERIEAHLHAYAAGQGDAIHPQVRRESIEAAAKSKSLDARESQHD